MTDSRRVFFGVVDAVVSLVVFGVALAADCVADSCGRQQVAFVSRVEKHLCLHGTTIFGRQFHDASLFLLDGRQPCLAEDGHPGFPDHFLEKAFGNMRLNRIRPAGRRTTVALECLVPVQRLAVAGDQPRKVLAGDPADTPRLADVHRAEPAGGHPPEMPSRLQQNSSLPHPRCLHSRDDAP